MPVPSTPVLDTFTRANEDPIAGGWLGPVFAGGAQMQVNANAATGRVGTDSNSYWRTAFPRDQEVFATLKQKWATADVNLALLLNLQLPNTVNVACYIVAIHTGSGSGQDELIFYRVDAGPTFTQLGATVIVGAAGTFANGCKLWAQNVGGTLSVYHLPVGGVWTLLGQRTDTTYGAGLVGLGADDNTVISDDFGGGAIGSVSRWLELF